jgi:hypothetical protein
MVAYVKFEQFTEDLAHGVHDLGSEQLTIALFPAATVPSVSADAVLADIGTETVYTNLSTRNITLGSSGQATGTYDLVLNDLTLTASGGAVAAFRYVVVYNDGTTALVNPLICYFDYGSDLVLADGESLVIDFESDGPTDGSLFTLA